MAYFWVVKRIHFHYSIFEETLFIAIFDRPLSGLKDNFNRPNKFLFDWVDWASGISKAVWNAKFDSSNPAGISSTSIPHLFDHHYHHVVPLARISLTLSRHFSQSFIASGRSSGLHPVSSHSCCMYVRAGPPDFARPYAGVHRSTSLMSSSLLLQQCPACLVRLTSIVFMMGGRWLYSWRLVGCCRQDLFDSIKAQISEYRENK